MAADFFTVEVWTRRGLQRFFVLFFTGHTQGRNCRHCVGAVGLWMSRIGRNLTEAPDDI